MPTGGGKSICFQVPAILLDGVCLVVTPLIALIQDQVLNLSKKGIRALSIYSGMSAREIDITLDNAIYGDYSFLYISPERLQTDIFIERFKKMKVSFIAVDEAHCISQWGYDFRPSYLKIADLKKIKPDLFFLALTATATDLVVKDIQEKLEFKKSTVFKSSFVRDNLKYVTLKSQNKLDDIVFLLNKMSGSGIIYCQTRRQTKTLHKHLSSANISTNFYHAGLDREMRKNIQSEWMSNNTRVIISTNAFGMGIDKSDVRFVIHYDVPDNIESYFQEAGRAGRDLQKARAILLFNDRDLSEISNRIELKFPNIRTIKLIYNALGNHLQLAIGSGKEESFNLNLVEFSTKYNLNFHTVYNALKILENNDLIKLVDYNFLPSRLKILVNKTDLYQYQIKNEKHNRIIQFILRSHLGIFDEYLTINESIISKKLKVSIKEIRESLSFLKKQNVVDYIPQSNGYQLTYLTERLSDQNFSISSSFYQLRKDNAFKKSFSMIEFLKNTDCRQTYLLNYFDEFNTDRCGQCNVCLNISQLSHQKDLSQKILENVNIKLKSNKSISIKDICEEFKNHNKQAIIESIRWLSENGTLKIDQTGRYIID